jgi:hypothetical protein
VERLRDEQAQDQVATEAPVAVPVLPGLGSPAAVLALQRAAGNRATGTVLARQPAPQTVDQAKTAPPTQKRRTIVAIMGADRAGDPNEFYTYALRYWRAHREGATFVTDQRHLAGLLGWITTNVSATERIDELVIVSHANEDGTLSFGLDAADADSRLTFAELRDALKAGKLPKVGDRVDAATKIRIKGCDIGRSKEMVDMVDAAFGGAGVVTAPTHEQHYEFDPTIARDAQRVREARIRTEVEAANPMPAEVPKPGKKATADEMKAYRAAVAERAKAVKARSAAIATGIKDRQHEATEMAEKMGTVEAFSGPMFQRPGSKLFTEDELRPQIDKLYGHLSETQRKSIATRLVATDRRPLAQQVSQRTFSQHGQRVDRLVDDITFPDPKNLSEALAVYGKDYREGHFAPKAVKSSGRPTQKGGFRVEIVLEGRFTKPGEDAFDGEWTSSAPWDADGKESVVPDDATLLAKAKARTAVPDKYTWTMEETHAKGMTTRAAVGTRVIAYLHHESLNASPHDWFSRPESDPSFFATSTFAPAPPTPPKKP